MAVSANCQNGSPKRRASSSPTQAASSVGSIAVEPRAAWAATACTTGSGAWPAIAPVSPRQRSTYSWPSTSTTRAPFASWTKTGKPPAQRAIQLIGTPNRSEERERSLSSSERGCARAKRVELAFEQRAQPVAVDRDHTPARSLDGHQSSFAITCLICV